MTRWNVYHQLVGDKPNSLVSGVLGEYDIGREAALDLGAGNFRDSRFFVAAGFKHVVAVDSAELDAPTGIEFHRMRVEQFVPPDNYFDIVISCNTLFFLEKNDVLALFRRIHGALRVGGIFACNLLGVRDGWVVRGDAGISWFTAEDMLGLRTHYNVTAAADMERDATTVSGKPKHWHTWSLVFQK